MTNELNFDVLMADKNNSLKTVRELVYTIE